MYFIICSVKNRNRPSFTSGLYRWMSEIERHSGMVWCDDNDVRISAFDEVENIIRGMTHLFQNEDLYNVEENLDTILSEVDQVEKYYDFYLKKLPRLKRDPDALIVFFAHFL